jgi:hypothetical protein
MEDEGDGCHRQSEECDEGEGPIIAQSLEHCRAGVNYSSRNNIVMYDPLWRVNRGKNAPNRLRSKALAASAEAATRRYMSTR